MNCPDSFRFTVIRSDDISISLDRIEVLLRTDGFRAVTIRDGNNDVIIYDGSRVALLPDGSEVITLNNGVVWPGDFKVVLPKVIRIHILVK